jgi:hypothetical protein
VSKSEGDELQNSSPKSSQDKFGQPLNLFSQISCQAISMFSPSAGYSKNKKALERGLFYF